MNINSRLTQVWIRWSLLKYEDLLLVSFSLEACEMKWVTSSLLTQHFKASTNKTEQPSLTWNVLLLTCLERSHWLIDSETLSRGTFEFGLPATDQTDEAAGDKSDHFGRGLHFLLQQLSAQPSHLLLLRPAACRLFGGGVPFDGLCCVRFGNVVFPHHVVDAQTFQLVLPATDQTVVPGAVEHQHALIAFGVSFDWLWPLGGAVFFVSLPFLLLLSLTAPLCFLSIFLLLLLPLLAAVITSSPALPPVRAVSGDDVFVQFGEVSAGVETVGAVEQPGRALVHHDVAEATDRHAVQAGGVRGRHVGQLVGVTLGVMAAEGALEVSRHAATCFTTSLDEDGHGCFCRGGTETDKVTTFKNMDAVFIRRGVNEPGVTVRFCSARTSLFVQRQFTPKVISTLSRLSRSKPNSFNLHTVTNTHEQQLVTEREGKTVRTSSDTAAKRDRQTFSLFIGVGAESWTCDSINICSSIGCWNRFILNILKIHKYNQCWAETRLKSDKSTNSSCRVQSSPETSVLSRNDETDWLVEPVLNSLAINCVCVLNIDILWKAIRQKINNFIKAYWFVQYSIIYNTDLQFQT